MTLTAAVRGHAWGVDNRRRPMVMSTQSTDTLTINKSQGQTLDIVGICLKKPVFAHGQLYVALSQVLSKNSVSTCVD